MTEDIIYFAKLRPDAIIPSKREEDGGYDLYACFDEEYIFIPKGEIRMIPTGIASAFNKKWRVVFQERGSTGVIGLKVNAGLVDSGYRDQWFVLLNNTSNANIEITKAVEKTETWDDGIHKLVKYPYSKAIAQFKLQEVPQIETQEISYDNLLNIKSERGFGKIGSSNK